MPGTQINSNSNTAAGTQVSTTLAVQAGDLIISGMCGFFPTGFGPPVSYFCNDTASNVYEVRSACARGYGHVSFAWAIAQTTGTITITHGESYSQWHTHLVSNIRWSDGDAPPLSEWAMLIGPSAGSTPPFYAFTNYFSIADSTIITLAGAVGSFGAVNFTSYSGDTQIIRDGYSPAQSAALFIRSSTGPGVENSKIGNDLGYLYAGQSPIIVGVFSRPLSRPGGTTEQYQVRPGCGFTSSPGNEGGYEAPYYLGEVNRPICVTLPYLPVVGSLLCIGVSQQSHVVTPTVSDLYSNTYTLRGISAIGGSSANQCVVALYTCIVANLPPSGQAYIVRASLPGPYTGVVYQPTAIGVAERDITGKVITNYQVAIFDDVDVDVFRTFSLTVPANSYLFAFAANATNTEGYVAWTAQNGFTLRANATFSQDLIWSVANDARCGAAAILDMVPNADGTYVAKIKDVQYVNSGGSPVQNPNPPSGGMAMLGVTLVSNNDLTITCPILGVLVKCVSVISYQVIASGGTPPYTFEIIEGTLPAGLSMSSSGLITGTPTSNGSFFFRIRVTDSVGNTATT